MRFTFFICLLLTAFRFQDTLPKEAITQMIATEKAFAKMALDKNTPAAFLYFLAPDGVVFEKGMPQNGLEVWKNKKPQGLLQWQPIYAGMALSGDLGYSIGNWQASANEQAPASATGTFVTLWQKQNTGDWRVRADIGVAHKANSKQVLKERIGTFKPINNAVIQAERFVFMKDFYYWKNAKTALNPHEPHLSENILLIRDNFLPIEGKTNAIAFLQKNYQKKLIYTGLKTIVSQATDFACVYGSISGKATDKDIKGSFLRVWQQESNNTWKIVVDVETIQ
ncbi:hypothetical protein [Flectobacillus roseus]|uniref:hypothetical protein n=1 Tax=Flectobacillus roseus TaxID=502259 RepID=UPI0024B72E4A|nr:hypothetical protein [Flectobacillus roseus]MDI9871816.1 hypothetical protein [Flectobacillus roseus]